MDRHIPPDNERVDRWSFRSPSPRRHQQLRCKALGCKWTDKLGPKRSRGELQRFAVFHWPTAVAKNRIDWVRQLCQDPPCHLRAGLGCKPGAQLETTKIRNCTWCCGLCKLEPPKFGNACKTANISMNETQTQPGEEQ